jgi:ribosomal protein L37E
MLGEEDKEYETVCLWCGSWDINREKRNLLETLFFRNKFYCRNCGRKAYWGRKAPIHHDPDAVVEHDLPNISLNHDLDPSTLQLDADPVDEGENTDINRPADIHLPEDDAAVEEPKPLGKIDWGQLDHDSDEEDYSKQDVTTQPIHLDK